VSGNTTSTESGTLWIVATPIGTLDDCSPRARRVLDGAELILAEDTRRAGTLLRHLGIEPRGRVTSFHEHNERDRLPRVLQTLRAGGAVALMSDAGTPVLSDPGFILVREARREGLPVATIPGPSSFTAALAASGQPPLPATLGGFLPARSGPRRRRVAELARVPWTLVVLLSPHRLAAELADLADGLGHRRGATLLAELSKLHERAVTASLGELATSDDAAHPRGEYVVVIAPSDDGASAGEADSERVRSAYETALDAGMTRKDAMKAVASKLGISRKAVFDSLIDHETASDR
jgi:16S rRNA (cytidine1402-2'-O)-methyltransferase